MAKAPEPKELTEPSPAASLVVVGDEPFTVLTRAAEAVDTASPELLASIARSAVAVFAAGIPHAEPAQRDAVMRLHSLLFGS